jgi:hypothetical protein
MSLNLKCSKEQTKEWRMSQKWYINGKKMNVKNIK